MAEQFALSACARVLSIVKPGSILGEQIRERYGSIPNWFNQGAKEAEQMGYITIAPTGEQYNYRYTITADGAAACPTRRQIAQLDMMAHMLDVATDEEAYGHD